MRTDAQKTIHGPLITRPRPRGITGKYGNLPKVALPATTMWLAEQKVGRSLDAAETIFQPRRLSSGPSAASSQSSLQRCFWRTILNDRTPKFIPFFATLGPAILFKKYGDARTPRYSPCYYSRESYIVNSRRSRYPPATVNRTANVETGHPRRVALKFIMSLCQIITETLHTPVIDVWTHSRF